MVNLKLDEATCPIGNARLTEDDYVFAEDE